MIEARGIVKRFGAFTALDGVSVDVPTGSLTALLGPSGSGKSTLLRVIAGLEQPDAGEVLLDGEDVTRRPPQSRGVGFVFQHYAAFKHMTVWDNIAFGLTIRRRPRTQIKQRVSELLDLVQLSGLAERFPAASANAWGLHALSRSTRRSCCSTSRSARSMRACARSCVSGCGVSTTRRTRRR